jgi:putative hydrolase of the HAD superfamily
LVGRDSLLVQAILFDLFDTLLLLEDETIYYPQVLRKLYDSLVNNGIDVSYEDFQEAYFKVRERIYHEAFTTLKEHHFNHRIFLTLKELGFSFKEGDEVITLATMAFADELKQYIKPDSDVSEVLEKLNTKYKLGIITNFGIPKLVWDLLERYQLRNFFNTVIISAEAQIRKPSPELFRRALHILNVEPSRSVFIGDNPEMDIKGAKNIGMKTILIKRRSSGDLDIKPDRIIYNLEELLKIL